MSYHSKRRGIISVMSTGNRDWIDILAVFLSFPLAFGCGDSSDSDPSTNVGGSGGTGGTSTATGGTSESGGNSGASSSAKSSGCGKSAPLSTTTQQTTNVSGTSRGYFLSPPKNYNSNTAYPLVFVFHGAGDSGKSMQGWSGLEASATGGALFVYPDGINGIWDLENNGPDAKMFDQLVTTLQEAWCIDKNAIFAEGFSYGGWAATQMAVARPTVVRAIASIEGGGPQGGKTTDPAVAAMIIHGKADTAEPIASGISSRNHFVATNGCGSTTTAMTPSPCVTYTGCKAGKPVAWCEHPGPHEIPSFSAAGIWNFFMSVR